MAHSDLQALLDSLLPFAQSLLSKYGDFHPFGAYMGTDGEIKWVGVDAGEEFPEGQLLVDTLTEMFKKQADSDEIRAAAICYDSLVIPPGKKNKTDAIAFSLEHRSGESISVFVPYLKGNDGDVQYSELFAVSRELQFFPKLQ